MSLLNHYRAKGNTVVNQKGLQIAIVLPTNCTKKLAKEMAAYAAQQANIYARNKALRKVEATAAQDFLKKGVE